MQRLMMRPFVVWVALAAASLGRTVAVPAQAPQEGAAAPQGQAPQEDRGTTSAPPGRGAEGATQGRGAGAQGRGAGTAGSQGRGAQANIPPSRGVALTTTSHAVADLERTAAFYKTVFGFEIFGDLRRPLVNSAMSKLTATPGALYRQAALKIPHTGLVYRLVEFTGVDRTPIKTSLTNPGQIGLRLFVGDMDAALASLQKAKAEIVVPAAAPAGRGGAARAGSAAPSTPSLIIARDPDGYWIEIEHGEGAPPSNVGAAAVAVLNSRVILVTADTDKKIAFYKGLLGMDLSAAGAWTKMPEGPGEIRQSISKEFGGANRTIEVCEYRNAGPSTPVDARLQDPGVTMVSFIVRDLDDTLKAIKEASLPIVSTGGEPVTIAKLNRIVVRDPDGAYVELVQE